MNYQFLSQMQYYNVLDERTTYDLFNAYKLGDLNARQTLILHNVKLVMYIQKKYDPELYDDDMMQIGIIGLIKAVNAFDISKKYQFATFATTCIENEILMYLRKKNKTKIEISLTTEREIHDGSGDTYSLEEILESPIPTPEQEYVDDAEKDIVFQLVQTLDEPDKQVLMAFYGFDGTRYTQQQISQMTGLSQPYISRIIHRSTNNIKIKYLKSTQ